MGHLRRLIAFAPLMLATAGAVVLCLAPTPAIARVVGSSHDFVAHGFTGGGACAECHVPHNADTAAGRLYPRPGNTTNYATAPGRLCMDCHDGSMPTDAGWPVPWTQDPLRPTPPPNPHSTADTCYDVCTKCHFHEADNPFGPPPNDDCLLCHRPGDPCIPDVDTPFAGVGSDAASPNIEVLSQHNIKYVTDGNVITYESMGSNECKKCHGDLAEDGVALRHPSRTVRRIEDGGSRNGMLRSAFLVYSDPLGNAVRPYDEQPLDKRPYDVFCLECHRGKARTSTPSSEEFSGSVPSHQVPPSDRVDPWKQQAGPSWLVPAVPPKDNLIPDPYTNPDPDGSASRPFYFKYYDQDQGLDQNGHGVATAPITGNLLDAACLSGGGGVGGCHVPHGSKSRFLFDDTIAFAPGAKTASAVAVEVCMAEDCHGAFKDPAVGPTANTFHGWWADKTILHDNSTLNGVAGVLDGMSQWREYGVANMNITGSPGAKGVLPFYTGAAGAIEGRSYPTALTNASWLMCLTCHDPHGTGPKVVKTVDDLQFTNGMLRIYDNDMAYGSPLCGQCHKK